MKTFAIHIILAFLGSYVFFMNIDLIPYNATTAALLFIFLFALLWLSAALYHKSYFGKLPKAVNFLLFFLKELFVANIKIAYDIITPRYIMEPTIIALPLAVKTDMEITILACMITLTPGTLSLDVSEDKTILYVHALYLKNGDVEDLKQELKHGFERRILELTA